MKVTIRKAGVAVAELRVENDGAISLVELRSGRGATITLSAQASRRIAGEVMRLSVEHTVKAVKGRARKAAHSEIERLLGGADDDEG